MIDDVTLLIVYNHTMIAVVSASVFDDHCCVILSIMHAKLFAK